MGSPSRWVPTATSGSRAARVIRPGWAPSSSIPTTWGRSVVVTTEPPNVEETVFGGYIYGFGLVVSVENSAGQIDPFVQQGTITIALDDDPGGGALRQGRRP